MTTRDEERTTVRELAAQIVARGRRGVALRLAREVVRLSRELAQAELDAERTVRRRIAVARVLWR